MVHVGKDTQKARAKARIHLLFRWLNQTASIHQSQKITKAGCPDRIGKSADWKNQPADGFHYRPDSKSHAPANQWPVRDNTVTNSLRAAVSKSPAPV